MKKAIVVGASSGMGRGIAKVLVDNDYQVGITGRRLNLLNEIKQEKPDSYLIKSFDITDTKNIPNHLNELVQELNGLDLLIISSGIGGFNEKLDFAIEEKTINTNVSGFTALADWAFNYFVQQKYGHLVAISSVAGLRGYWQSPSYSASKAFQIIYLDGLRQKARRTGEPINVTDIRPGFVDTYMAQSNRLFWLASVDKAAKQIFQAIKAKRKIAYITKRWRIVAVLMKLLPNWIYDKI